MRHRYLMLWLAFCLVATSMSAQADPEWVYLSNGKKILRLDPVACAANPIYCDKDILLEQYGAVFEGLNYGPDERLYWCDPTKGKLGRISFDPYGAVADNVVLYNKLNASGPAQPQCGWFTFEGDFIVTNKSGGAVWLFAGLASAPDPVTEGSISAVQVLSSSDVGSGLLDQVTEYLDGDALLVNQSGSVRRSEFPDFLGPAPSSSNFTNGLTSPNGVAVSYGYVFVTDGKKLKRYDSTGMPKGPYGVCTTFGSYDDASHVAATVNGRLFVGTSGTSGTKPGKLYRVIFNPVSGTCSSTLIAELKLSHGFVKTVGGVAVTPTSLAVMKPAFAGTQSFTFNSSNTWQLTAGTPGDPGAPCTATIEYRLSPPGLVGPAIDEALEGEPNDPEGAPVSCLSCNGFSEAWDFDDVFCPGAADGFHRHLVSGFYPAFSNPRIGLCDQIDPVVGDCEIITLTAYIPFDPNLLPIDPIGGKRDPGGSDYFLMEVEIDAPGVAGTFCGFQPPLSNTEEGEPPIVRQIGSTIPIKFKLAAGTNGDCQNGPYVSTIVQALLSVLNTDTGEIMDVHANGKGTEDPAFFDDPNQPTKTFHYNLDTSGYSPGLHVLTVMFYTGNAPVQQTLVELVD